MERPFLYRPNVNVIILPHVVAQHGNQLDKLGSFLRSSHSVAYTLLCVTSDINVFAATSFLSLIFPLTSAERTIILQPHLLGRPGFVATILQENVVDVLLEQSVEQGPGLVGLVARDLGFIDDSGLEASNDLEHIRQSLLQTQHYHN